MENQHKRIIGYRDLGEDEIALMNEIKAKAAEVGQLVERLAPAGLADQRWVAIGATHLQQGFMALVRSVARPGGF